MSDLSKYRAALFWSGTASLFLWFSWDFWIGMSDLIQNLWAWKPAFVIGLAMMIFPLLLAFPSHYFLNVRRANQTGVVEVRGFADCLGHGALNAIVRFGFFICFFWGLFILLFGF